MLMHITRNVVHVNDFVYYLICVCLCLTDEDECASDTSNSCTQQCMNTHGGFRCACDQGYMLNADGKTCDGEYGETLVLYR